MADARTWRHNVLCLAAAIGLALFAASDTAATQQRSYWIEDFSSTLEIGEDGVLSVNEAIRFYFDGSYNGIYRDIPVSYVDEVGFDYKLRWRWSR